MVFAFLVLQWQQVLCDLLVANLNELLLFSNSGPFVIVDVTYCHICGNKMPTRCNRWYLLQSLLLAQHVSGTIIPITRSSRVLYRWSLPVVFGALVFKLSVWCGAEGYKSGLQAAACKPDAVVYISIVICILHFQHCNHYLLRPRGLQFLDTEYKKSTFCALFIVLYPTKHAA